MQRIANPPSPVQFRALIPRVFRRNAANPRAYRGLLAVFLVGNQRQARLTLINRPGGWYSEEGVQIAHSHFIASPVKR